MTLILSHADVAGLLSIDEIIAAVRSGLREQAAGLVQLPARTTIDSRSGQGWLRVMPAILNGSGVMGYKAMHSTPGVGVRYLVSLYDMATGALLAQIDADWLTAQRTAATAAVAADILAKPEIATVGILGSSDQSRAMLAALARVRTPGAVAVFSPTAANRRRFAAQMAERLDLSIAPVDSARAAVVGADIVLSVFRAGSEPSIAADWIGAGTHIHVGSSIRPENRELMDEVWRKATCVVVDDREHVFDSGDGRSALASGAARIDGPAELWQVLSGVRTGRQNDQDITLFKAVGTGLQDLSVAHALYRRALDRGLGREIGDFPQPRATR